MHRLISSLKKKNEGSAIVVVIIALAFVGVLAATAMWMSMTNYRMKATDKGIKSNFYTAETVFEEIVAGLQEESSKAAGIAYTKVLENYSDAGSDSERYSRFVKYYKDALVDALHDSGDTTKYKTSVITDYLDSTLQSRLLSGSTGNKLTMSPATLEVSGVNMDFITLKNFELEFTDDNGYYSVIKTDIMITAPEISFTMSSPVPDVFKYAIIADKGIENKIVGTTEVNGNIYSGADGIRLTSGGLTINDAEYAISMGNVILSNTNSELKVDQTDPGISTQFWANDISVGSTSGTSGGTVEINADTYVADDLTLNAPTSKVTLKGKYTGYGNGGVTGSKDDANHNSAIMINNLNSKLDMSGLSEVNIAGSSFVDLAKYYTDPATRKLYEQSPAGVALSANNIPMGESIAVKSDQIAFLVPEECLWVTWDMKSTAMTQNPVAYNDDIYHNVLLEYCEGDSTKVASFDETVRNNGISGQPNKEIYEVMLDKPLSNGKTLSAYVNSTNDIIRVFSKKSVAAVGDPAGSALIYYYMKMSSESARKFIQEYYKNNTEKLNKYFAVYVKESSPGEYELTLPSEDNISSQGAFLADSLDGIVSENKMHDTTVKSIEQKQALEDKISSCTTVIASLTNNLTENGTPNPDIDSDSPISHVYENIIDSTKIKQGCYMLDDGYYAYVTKDSDFTISSTLAGNEPSKCRLLIAEGNVNIESDINFTGVMLVKGILSINKQSKITSVEKELGAQAELVRVLQCPFSGSDSTTPISMFRNASGYVIAGTQIVPRDGNDNAPAKVDVMKTVNYKNWIKK